MKMGITLRAEGTNVELIVDGKLVSIMPWQAADMISRAITAKAREAEEYAKAEAIIADNAILFRAGAPLGLSRNPAIIKETIKEAVHNRDLRRYLPNVKSREIVYSPIIRTEAPKCS